MGYQTPNIDRIANEGMLFTDYYGEQSCTAWRSAFITGQHPIRTGLTKVGIPGAETGLQPEDPTLAELLKPYGYTSGQFGKNHLGDRDEFLPTNHGFNEFYGNLYHLNAEEVPEDDDYPQHPEFHQHFGPRGVIYSRADGGIEDSGPHYNQWPDAAITPYQGDKNTNWEGGYRVPAMVRWPGKIRAGSISNTIMSHLDWVPTLMSVVGNNSVEEELRRGKVVGERTFQVHLNGYNFLPYLTGSADTDSNSYNLWWDKKIGWAGMLGSAAVIQFVESLHEFPPRQRPASFSVDQIMETIERSNETETTYPFALIQGQGGLGCCAGRSYHG